METIETVLVASIGMLLMIVAFVVGRAIDPIFRARIMKKLTKRKYGCLALCDIDRKAIDKVIVDLSKDMVYVKGFCWIINNGDIYRQDKPEHGFKIKDEMLRYEEGVPTIYVDSTSLRPLKIEGAEVTTVKPDNIASILSAWLSNERAKLLASMGSMNMIILLCLFASLGAAGLSYMNMDNMKAITVQVNQTHNDLGLIKTSLGIVEVVNQTAARR